MKIKKLLLNGKCYGEEILKITDDYMKTKLEQGIKNILGFSLASHVPTPASAPQNNGKETPKLRSHPRKVRV